MEDYNVMIDGRNLFDQPVKNDLNGCLLEYLYFKEYYQPIAINLSKQQKLDANPKEYNKLILLVI